MATMQLTMFADLAMPERPQPTTTYFLGQCPRCNRTQRATVEQLTVYGPWHYKACECLKGTNSTGVQVPMHPIKATYHAGTRCDSRCMSATGHECLCSCGGRNHGRYA